MADAGAALPAIWRRCLPVYAAPVEGDALRDLGARRLGVGKTAAAAACAALLVQARPPAVLLFGVAGAYPARHRRGARLQPLDLCVVGTDTLADDGVLHDGGFLDLQALGLGTNGPFSGDAEATHAFAAQLGGPVVSGATVSTCSGTEAASAALAARTGAEVETMEGAAVAYVCAQAGVPFAQVRCVSNWTGERARGAWDLAGAAARLQATVRALLQG